MSLLGHERPNAPSDGTSEAGGTADLDGTKADIVALMSLAEGKAEELDGGPIGRD